MKKIAVSKPEIPRPIRVSTEGYAGSETCLDCHKRNHATWYASYHRTMTQLPENGLVLGDFENADIRFGSDEHTYRTRKHSGRLWVEMDNQSNFQFNRTGKREEFPIELMTGSHHMQLYWISLGIGRNLGLLPIVYLNEAKRWVPRRSVFLRPPVDYMDVELSRWGRICIDCHSTKGRANPSMSGQNIAFDTRVAEFGISCESCHGPAASHVALRQRMADNKGDTSSLPDDSIVNPSRLPHTLSSQVCGNCHGVHSSLNESSVGNDFLPGQNLTHYRHVHRKDSKTRSFLKSTHSDGYPDDASVDKEMDLVFWDDGVPRVAGREYNSLSQSACHVRGKLSCISCHVLHKSTSDLRTLESWANDLLGQNALGDEVCLSCHKQTDYASRNHTHHGSDSPGSRCYNCHMPHTSYALLKGIRSHTIDSPRVVSPTKNARPNACNLCHLDKTLEWSANHLQKWFQTPVPKLEKDEREIAAGINWATKGHAGHRAFAAWHMGWPPAIEASGTNWMAPYLGTLMDDSYDAVRYIAHRSLRSLGGYDDIKYDFVGSSKERNQAAQEVFDRWSRQAHSGLTGRNELLMDQQNRYQTNRFQELLSRRDNTPVNLIE